MECNFCKSILKTVSSLNYHIKNNKKCLEIQSQTIGQVNSALVVCEYCNNSFSNIKKHLNICKEKKKELTEKLNNDYEKLNSDYKKLKIEYEKLKIEYEKINEVNNILRYENEKLINENKKIQELKEYIIKLETENNIYKKDHETINDIAKQPKTTNTSNIINNLSVYDDDEIKSRFHIALTNIKPSDLYDGQKSIGRFVAPCLKNDDGTKMITCTDHSRNVFMYKDKNGNVNKDIKCKNLAELIEPIASAKADEFMKEDNHTRIRSFRFLSLKKQLIEREEEIKHLNSNLLGLEKNSKAWKHTVDSINKKMADNNRDKNEIEELQNEGVVDFEEDPQDDKLLEAVDDIKDMQKDSTKFSKVLSELL
jgi:hypothetical protein